MLACSTRKMIVSLETEMPFTGPRYSGLHCRSGEGGKHWGISTNRAFLQCLWFASSILSGGGVIKCCYQMRFCQLLIILLTASCPSNGIHRRQRQLLVHSPWLPPPLEGHIARTRSSPHLPTVTKLLRKPLSVVSVYYYFFFSRSLT